MKKLSNTEAELKKGIACEKKHISQYSTAFVKELETTNKVKPLLKLTSGHSPRSIITFTLRGRESKWKHIQTSEVSDPVM